MIDKTSRVVIILAILIVSLCATITAQKANNKTPSRGCDSAPNLSGVYRIDVDRSDRLYSVIEGVSSRVPYSAQQQFFMDLAVRLTPPDLLAIECRGNRVSLGSSRASRIEFAADGVTRNVSKANGAVARSRIGFERGSLVFVSSGGGDDDLNFIFTPLDNGQSLQVSRRISSKELIEPVVIKTVYGKINDVARWDIFDDASTVAQTKNPDSVKPAPEIPARNLPVRNENDEVEILRTALNQWIAATNELNIGKQMSFYMPQLKAFYLARNASQSLVREEKNRAFAAAKSIDIRAAEPEIVFQDGGRAAIMRFRKKYRIENKTNSRSGEVVQELRWQRTDNGWKIFSERDIKVLR